jgi:hypothetical protein
VKLFSSLVYQEKPATTITNTNHHEWLSKQMTPHSNLSEFQKFQHSEGEPKRPPIAMSTGFCMNVQIRFLLQEKEANPTRHEVMPFVSYSLRARVKAS